MSTSNVSRREFLNYLLFGSGAMIGVGTVTGVLWYAQGTPYSPGNPLSLIRVENIQATTIQLVSEARAYLVNLETGLIALSRICPFLNTPVTWVQINNRFECPMCGSKYELDGSLISGGISPRNLDRFYMRVFTSDGTFEVDSLEDAFVGDMTTIRELWIDTARVIQGRSRGA